MLLLVSCSTSAYLSAFRLPLTLVSDSPPDEFDEFPRCAAENPGFISDRSIGLDAEPVVFRRGPAGLISSVGPPSLLVSSCNVDNVGGNDVL